MKKLIIIIGLNLFLFSCSNGLDNSKISKTTDGQQNIENAKIKILENTGSLEKTK